MMKLRMIIYFMMEDLLCEVMIIYFIKLRKIIYA